MHTFQLMYGCEWDDQTGATNGFRREGYDGEDFLSLDLNEMRWISPVQWGFSTQNKWNNNRAYLEGRKHYFSTECIEWLTKYVEYSKSSLEKMGIYSKSKSIFIQEWSCACFPKQSCTPEVVLKTFFLFTHSVKLDLGYLKLSQS